MVNPFIKGDVDPVLAEAINGAQLMFACMTPKFTLFLPADYDAGNFLANEQKVVFALVNLILDSNTEIASNKIALKTGSTVGTAIIRIYPNIEPFKSWLNLAWTKTVPSGTTITCQLLKDMGVTLVDSSLTSGEDLSTKELINEYIDFKFTLTADGSNKPTLDTLTLQFTGGL